MSTAERRLSDLGITLPTPAAPVANYVAFARSGNLLVISGQICLGADGTLANYVPTVRSGNMLVVSGQLCLGNDGKLVAKGQLGGSVSIEDGAKAARTCAINVLAQAKAALGDLDKVVRVVRLGGFINAAPGFVAVAQVMNGASDLMVEVLGDKGRHARSTIGVAELPLDAAVEVEAMFEVE